MANYSNTVISFELKLHAETHIRLGYTHQRKPVIVERTIGNERTSKKQLAFTWQRNGDFLSLRVFKISLEHRNNTRRLDRVPREN